MRGPLRAAPGLLLPPPAPGAPPAPDPVEPDALAVHAESKGRYGARKVKASPERRGVVAGRRRISRIMRENGPSSAYGGKRFKAHPGKPNEAEPPNVLDRSLGGRAPRTHVCSGLACVRVGGSRCYVCLLVDLCSREIAGRSAGSRRDAGLVKAAESAPFPLTHGVPFRHDAVNGERGHGMGHPSPKYSAEFKQQAVGPYRERGGAYAEIARGLGVDCVW